MQTQNRLFDDLARVAGGALGALSGLREEIELVVRGRLERILADMDLVTREEFEAVKAAAAEARLEAESLAARVAELEARLTARVRPAAGATTARRHAARPGAAAGVKAARGGAVPANADDGGPEEADFLEDDLDLAVEAVAEDVPPAAEQPETTAADGEDTPAQPDKSTGDKPSEG